MGIGEDHSRMGQRIDIRSLEVGTTHETEIIVSGIVQQYNQYIWTIVVVRLSVACVWRGSGDGPAQQ